MAISYNIYSNDSQGGSVDYDSRLASTSSLSYVTGPLVFPSDNTFAVRVQDTISGIEEANTDARVRIVLDATGNDVTLRPNPVLGLLVKPLANGACWVAWEYCASGQGGPPVQFNVFLNPGSIDTATNPVTTLTYTPGISGYSCFLDGLSGDTIYSITVQVVGSSNLLISEARNVTFNYKVTELSSVDFLVASPSL